jgi:hypothetical protein
MPKGPKGEKRPADVIGAAVMVGRIAAGEVTDSKNKNLSKVAGGKAGGVKRDAAMSASAKVSTAKKAAAARWKKV